MSNPIFIRGNWAGININLLGKGLFNKFQKDLTISYKNFVDMNVENKLYLVLKPWEKQNQQDYPIIWIPRIYMYSKYHEIKKAYNHFGKILTINMNSDISQPWDILASSEKDQLNNIPQFMNYALTPDQDEGMKFMMDKYFRESLRKSYQSGCTLVMPCGTGKTIMGCYMIYLVKKKTIWITNNNITVDQCIEAINYCMPYLKTSTDALDVGKVDVVVSTVHNFVLENSRFLSASDAKTKDMVGLVIYDEIHTLGSAVYGQIFNLFGPRYQLGLTATPLERDDQMYFKYLYTVGEIYIPEKIKSVPFNGKVIKISYFNTHTDKHRKRINAEKKKSSSKDIMITALTVKNIVSDPKRYVCLDYAIDRTYTQHADKIKQLPPEKNLLNGINRKFSVPGIIIFCEYIEPMYEVMHYLETNPKYKHLNIGRIMSEMSDHEEELTLKTCDIIIGNRKLLTGVSLPRFTTLIIWTTLKKGTAQLLGRVCRFVFGNEDWNNLERVIYDITDTGALSQFQYNSYRRIEYANRNWPVEEVKITV